MVWTEEENYKFKLSHFQPLILEWLTKNATAIRPKYQYELIMAQLAKPLGDLSISRPKSRVSWGIDVPGDDGHSIYVWLDALVNYLTVTGYPSKTPSSYLHIIGKDILKYELFNKVPCYILSCIPSCSKPTTSNPNNFTRSLAREKQENVEIRRQWNLSESTH